MHTLPHKNLIFPLQAYNNLDLMFLRSTSGHVTSNVPDAAGTKFNVAKSHEQHVVNAVWSEDLPSNTTMPDPIIILVYRPPTSQLSDFDDIPTPTRE